MADSNYDECMTQTNKSGDGGWGFSDQSSNLQLPHNQLDQFQFQDSQIQAFTPQIEKKQVKKKRKKKQKKFGRQTYNQVKEDQRSVKKYARFDTMNQVFEKFTSKRGSLWQELKVKQKLWKVSRRSLKYMFLGLGILKRQKELERYYQYFKIEIKQLLQNKYRLKSQAFKNCLQSIIYNNEIAISYFLQGNERQGIKVAYAGNQRGEKGRTKNPKQMERCQQFYQDIFSINHKSNLIDLDMLLI